MLTLLTISSHFIHRNASFLRNFKPNWNRLQFDGNTFPKKKSHWPQGKVQTDLVPSLLGCRAAVALQVARKTSSCDTPCSQLVSQRKTALQVAEKVEVASTFRNARRQVAACDTPPLQLVSQFFEKEPITIRHNQNAADVFKYSFLFLILQKKFKKEEKQNRDLIEKALSKCCYLHFTLSRSVISSDTI